MRLTLGRLVSVAALLSAAASSAGCAPSARGASEVAQGPVALEPAPVDEASFAPRLREVLADGTRAEQRRKLALGVARRQLLHARERFELGADERALASVYGAFYLLRAGELSPRIFDADTGPALDAAIARLSARGDDGRARVLLLARAGSLEGAAKAERMKRVEAIDRWLEDIRSDKPIERAGQSQRSSLARSLLDDTAVAPLLEHTSRWIDLAIDHNVSFRQTGKRPSPEEQLESVRALETGALSVVAIALRWGDLDGSLRSVESTSARRTIDPEFYALLRKAVERDDGEALRAVFVALNEQVGGRIGGDLGVDPDLLEAAGFGLLVEAYRRDDAHLATAVWLSRALMRLGMSEAVPLVLEPCLDEGAAPDQVSVVLGTVAQAVEADTAVSDGAAAARTIAASASLLSRAQRVLGAERSSPSVSELRYRMGSAAVRAGRLPLARPLFEQALADEPSAGGRLVLAMIERQSDQAARALELLAATASDRRADPLERAEAALLALEIQREAGRPSDAERALQSALELAGAASLSGPTRAYRIRSWRTLGRALALAGAVELSAQAFGRALDEARAERSLVGTTMLHAIANAWVLGDAGGARRAWVRGQQDGATEEDLVYGALWVGFAATDLRRDDPTLQLLDSASGGNSWTSRLAAWRLGRTSDEELARQANTEATKVEAEFYVAMSRKPRVDPGDERLRAVARSAMLDLMEVQIARDLGAGITKLSLPKAYKLP